MSCGFNGKVAGLEQPTRRRTELVACKGGVEQINDEQALKIDYYWRQEDRTRQKAKEGDHICKQHFDLYYRRKN